MRRLLILLLFSFVLVPLHATDPDLGVQRRSPSSFRNVPNDVMKWLQKQKCLIPQVQEVPTPNNLISGEFAAKGQKDWAALCSRNSSSTIVVLWGGKSRCDGVLAESADSLSMQDGGRGKYVYSRMISPIGERQILKRQKAFGGTVPTPLAHQGIDDIFVGKASVTYYCHRGEWRKLQGAD
jgi:hypothetical protein